MEYDAGGSLLPGRNYSSSTYAFGFNGMRKDDEIHGATGTSYDFGARLYDPRVGRWWSIDPLAGKYAFASPYCFALANPILFIDYDGRDIVITHNGESFTFTAQNTAYTGNNDFIQQTVSALNHLMTYEAMSDAQHKIVTELASDASVVAYVEHTAVEQHPTGIGAAKWNPKQGTYVRDAKTGQIAPQSPAGTLIHELGHQYDELFQGVLIEALPKYPSQEQIIDYHQRSQASPFGSFLEEGVIVGVENPYYQ